MAGFQQRASQLGDVPLGGRPAARRARCSACAQRRPSSRASTAWARSFAGNEAPPTATSRSPLPARSPPGGSECGQAAGPRSGVAEHSVGLPARAGRAQSPQVPSGRAGLGQQLWMRVADCEGAPSGSGLSSGGAAAPNAGAASKAPAVLRRGRGGGVSRDASRADWSRAGSGTVRCPARLRGQLRMALAAVTPRLPGSDRGPAMRAARAGVGRPRTAGRAYTKIRCAPAVRRRCRGIARGPSVAGPPRPTAAFPGPRGTPAVAPAGARPARLAIRPGPTAVGPSYCRWSTRR